MLSKNLQCNVYDQKQYNWLQCCIESQCYYCWDVKWFHIYCHNIPLRCIRTFYCIPYLLFSYLGVIKQPLNSFDSGIDTRLKDACIHSPSLLTWFWIWGVQNWTTLLTIVTPRCNRTMLIPQGKGTFFAFKDQALNSIENTVNQSGMIYWIRRVPLRFSWLL